MQGHIPVLMVSGESLAEAWENSLVALHKNGCSIRTEYDKPDDPPSKDATMIIEIRNPLSEPMIHKDFPGGLEDLQEYTLEVLDGIKDHCVRQNAEEIEDTRWEYTYHQRLFAYRVPNLEKPFDQIELMARRLSATPHTRRAQAITWQVWEDNFCYDPACLQSFWCRILPDEQGEWILHTNVRFRSNDAYKAAFMNMFALIQLAQRLATRIAELSGKTVRLGRYIHHADSYHLYGAYFREFEERFLRALETRSFSERTWNYADVQEIMKEAIPAILEKARSMGR
ncbi:hypothetical protein JW992_03095 [candidate division KSB1 bacterium]|nr:hypothetical protein [candidate division KSB1 bacterium]